MPPKKSYESYESDSEDSSSQKRRGVKKQKLEKNSDDYVRRRQRNNVAVRKSREASRQKAKETMEKVSVLREENKALEQKVNILNKELGVLRDLFLSHASATATAQAAAITKFLNSDDDDTEHDCPVKSEIDIKDHTLFVSGSSS
uniref:BZIP domain-containing protein n=1 Tax=Arion vulgaris TaxID=1028688 RepID=A0A0B7BTW1_9EUPU